MHVPQSQLVLELVGQQNPVGEGSGSLIPLETRMSSRNQQTYAAYKQDKNNLVYAVAAQRATANITAVDFFYSQVIQAGSMPVCLHDDAVLI